MLDHDKRKALQELFTGSLASIVEMVEAMDTPDDDKRDEAEQAIHEDALSVEVRSAWSAIGAKLEPAEFRIVLATGGPAVQIVGDLDERGTIQSATLQVQDWFTQWETFGTSEAEDEALLMYAAQFYFGE